MAKNKREEIVKVASELFFMHGYEGTSVRMIMDAVGGEIGMFYHHFKSKDILFDTVVERFFLASKERFEAILQQCNNPEEFIDAFLPAYMQAMDMFGSVRGNMHWSIQYAMHAQAIASMCPATVELLKRWNVPSDAMDMLASQLVHGVSATIHAKEFEAMDDVEKKQCLLTYINAILPKQT